MIRSKYKISAVESFTGGMFASEIISHPNASTFFRGSLVAYDSRIKRDVLGLDISKGVINKDIAAQMALKGNKYFDSDLCISFTGNAGPIAEEGMSIGFIYIAICLNNEVSVYQYILSGQRNEIRKQSVEIAINILKSKDIIEIY